MIYDLNQKMIKSTKDYWKRDKKIDEEIKQLEEKRKRLRYPDFENKFKPLIQKVSKDLNSDGYEIYGPFGMSSERTIYWKKDKNKCITENGNVLGSLCLICYGEGYAIRNESINTGRYAQGSIAEMNGANHPTIEITDNLTYNWLIEFIKRDK